MRETGRKVKERVERLENAMLLTLKMEDGDTSQEMQVTSKSWKEQENEFSIRASRKNQPC